MNIFPDGVYSIKDSAKILGVTEYYIEHLISKNKVNYLIDAVKSTNNTEEMDRINRLINTLNEYAISHFNGLLLNTKNNFTKNSINKFIKSKNVFTCMLDYYGYSFDSVRIILRGDTILELQKRKYKNKKSLHNNALFLLIKRMAEGYFLQKKTLPSTKYIYKKLCDDMANDKDIGAIVTEVNKKGDLVLFNGETRSYGTIDNWMSDIRGELKCGIL